MVSFNPATFNPASAFGGLGSAAGAGLASFNPAAFDFSSLAGGLGAAAGAGGAAAGAGGAASGLLGVAGGPLGMAFQGVTSALGTIAANKAAEASMENAMKRGWETATFNIAGDEYQKDRSYARQFRAKLDEDKIRRAGFKDPTFFQNLINNERFTPLGASRALSSPLFTNV
jgi:hypothetical protein